MNSDENKQVMIKEGIIPLLGKCLTVKNKRVIAQVASVIFPLAKDNVRIQNEFRKAGIINQLVEFLLEKSSLNASSPRKNIDTIRTMVLKALVALIRDNRTNLDAVIKAKGLNPIIVLLQARDEAMLVQALEAIWVIAQSGAKYQNSLRVSDEKNTISLFSIIPKLLLHYEESVALNACGALVALCDKNKKNIDLFLQNEATDRLQSMPETSNSLLQIHMTTAKAVLGVKCS